MDIWHILDVGSIWLKEFASALSRMEDVAAWAPQMERAAMFHDWHRVEKLSNPELTVLQFPLQRGYARAPLRWVAPFEQRLLKRMLAQTAHPEISPLVCSTPFYAPVAERWPGPVIYYLTDLAAAYPSLNRAQVESLDRRLCRVAKYVCPNSKRIADYLITRAGCAVEKITVIPNATRGSNVLEAPLSAPGPLPLEVQDLRRPIAGVLGDLSGNLDWELTAGAVQQTPGMQWLFVGPAEGAIEDAKQREARDWVKRHARFAGFKPYGELQSYARCFDVAVLPYRRKEPTYSGSSTRFYEHLASGRPMVATRGFAELLEKEPLLKLVDSAEDMAMALGKLQEQGFRDGQETERWLASRAGTWEGRAAAMRELVCGTARVPELAGVQPVQETV